MNVGHVPKVACNKTGALTSGFEADYAKACNICLDQVQPDVLDATQLPRVLEAHCVTVINVVLETELLSARGRRCRALSPGAAATQHAFAIGDTYNGEVAAIGFEPFDSGSMPVFAHKALRALQQRILMVYVDSIRNFIPF